MTRPHHHRDPSATRVSVIMPVFNACSSLRQALDSVLGQSHSELELVVIDDGSTDGSGLIIDEYARADPRIKAIHQSNGGVASARNAGLRAASGDCIAFLDADDWWHPEKLELQLRSMRATGARVSYTCYERVDQRGSRLNLVAPPRHVDWHGMLVSNRIGNLTGMYDRRLGDGSFQKIGHEDYVFWLEKVRAAKGAVRVETDEPLAFYRVSDNSLSSNKLRAAAWQWAIYRRHVGLGRGQATVLMWFYAVNALTKRRRAP